MQDVKVWLQRRSPTGRTKRPWIVRWAVDGRERSRSFQTKAEAERFRSLLLAAQRSGDIFDVETGEPETWLPPVDELSVHAWARHWLAEQWPEWQPRTRQSAVEALARFVPLLTQPGAPPAPEGLRAHLVKTLPPAAAAKEDDGRGQWLARWSLQLGDLNRSRLAEVDHLLGLGDKGQPLAAWTAARFRKVARACIRRAVDLEIVPNDPWPPATRGRSQRKAVRTKRPVDVRSLPNPATMMRALAAITSHQPASRMYQVMTAVMYYAGLRPSEVVMLRPRALHLPASGWGRLDVVEADVSFDEPGEPKTGSRSVPIPPQLVTLLRSWLEQHDFDDEALIFRTRNGNRPTTSNWARSWQRALRQIEHPPLRIYDCRHAAATTWLGAGVPLGEVASRLGHSVETLVTTYVGALAGDQAVANERIDSVLAEAQTGGDANQSQDANESEERRRQVKPSH